MKVLDDSGLEALVNNVKEKFSDISADTLKGTLPVAHGGTGATTAKAANNALMGYSAASSSGPGDATKFLVQKASPSDSDGAMETMTGAQLMSYIVGALPPSDTTVKKITGPTNGHNQVVCGNLSYHTLLGKVVASADIRKIHYSGNQNIFISSGNGLTRSIGTLPSQYRPQFSVRSGLTKIHLNNEGILDAFVDIASKGAISFTLINSSLNEVTINTTTTIGGETIGTVYFEFPYKW